MKKDILKLIESDDCVLRINEISYLHRWKRNALDVEVDELTITFSFVVGVGGGAVYHIGARDYDGIINEIERCTKDYLKTCADKAVKDLRNGYGYKSQKPKKTLLDIVAEGNKN